MNCVSEIRKFLVLILKKHRIPKRNKCLLKLVGDTNFVERFQNLISKFRFRGGILKFHSYSLVITFTQLSCFIVLL